MSRRVKLRIPPPPASLSDLKIVANDLGMTVQEYVDYRAQLKRKGTKRARYTTNKVTSGSGMWKRETK